MGAVFLKASLIAIGVVVLAVGACILLTDSAPSTMPRRTWHWLADLPSMWSYQPRGMENPPLVNIPVMTVDDARSEVRDEDFVVGVELKGETRAYPLNMLSRPDHHVLNDTLGGQPIAVTWCGLCQSPLVYERRLTARSSRSSFPGMSTAKTCS